MTIPTWVEGQPEQDRPIRLSDPGDLLAAVPALLGHYPERSLILLALGGPCGTELVAALRQDLQYEGQHNVEPGLAETKGGSWQLEGVLDQFVGLFEREQCHAAVAVVVDDRTSIPTELHRDIAEHVMARLDVVAGEPTYVYACERIEAGARWWTIGRSRRSGRMSDPDSSPLALSYVLAGRQIRRSRREFDELITPDALQQAQVWALMAAGASSADLELSLGLERDSGVSYRRRRVNQLLDQIRHLGAGEPLLAVEIAELGIALSDPNVRDVMVGITVSAQATAAEQLWLLLSRTLPDPVRAEAAVLLAYSAYVRGDGCLAAVAADAAVDSAPGHRLATLFGQAIQQGLHPSVVRELAEKAYDAALELGIDMPSSVSGQ